MDRERRKDNFEQEVRKTVFGGKGREGVVRLRKGSDGFRGRID